MLSLGAPLEEIAGLLCQPPDSVMAFTETPYKSWSLRDKIFRCDTAR